MPRYDAEVVIVGAGPAGSTAGNLLARRGREVLIVEKDPFPRFHIGESLLPCELPIFARLGISLEGAPFLRKEGAEFVDERTGDHTVYLFRDGLPGTPAHAYQVDRALYDHHLARAAVAAGATLREGMRVTDVSFDADHVEVKTTDGSLRARYFVDATGQDAFLARRRRTMQPIHQFGSAAIFCHFDDLSIEARDELTETGNIRVLIVPDGWMWLIPLHGGRLSCGLVTRRKGVKPEWLEEAIAASPMITRLTHGARRTDARILGNFSHVNRESRGPRWASIGDASVFLDPVFSSGVSLAMLGGEMLADRLGPALEEGREDDPALVQPIADRMKIAYVSFASLVGSFYHTRLVQHLFFAKEPDPRMRAGLISILAGDVFREDNAFQNALLTSARRRFDPFELRAEDETRS